MHSAVAFSSADVSCWDTWMAEKLYDANIYLSAALRNGVAVYILVLSPRVPAEGWHGLKSIFKATPTIFLIMKIKHLFASPLQRHFLVLQACDAFIFFFTLL